MKTILSTLLVCLGCLPIIAQRTVYLDKDARITENQTEAVGYAVVTNMTETKQDSVAFYSKGGKVQRISFYAPFADLPQERVLHGKTIYKFRDSEQDSLLCFYRRNLRQGAATYFYPDGKQKVRCTYKEGLLNGLLYEYFSNGLIRRKDIYEKGVATGSNLYSEDGELLGNSPYYVAPAPEMGLQWLMDTLSSEVKIPNDIWTKEGRWVVYLEALFDEKGTLQDVECVQTNYKPLIQPVVKQVSKVMQDLVYEPATMDKQPVAGSIVFPLSYRVELVNDKKKDGEAPMKEVNSVGMEWVAETQKILLDEHSNLTTNVDEAVEYVLVTHETLDKVKVEFYTMHDVLKERTYYQNFSWMNREKGRQGTSILFYSNGKDSLVCNYKNNKRVGKYTTYYPDGQVNLIRELEYNGRTKRLKQYYPDGSLKRVEEPGKEKIYYDEQGVQVIPYVPFEQKANVGIPQNVFMMMLGKEMKYPRDAQIAGVSGRVILRLHVTKTGKVDQIWVEKGVHLSLDREAHRAVSVLAKKVPFTPAYEDGKPVDGLLNIPINFNLGKTVQKVVKTPMGRSSGDNSWDNHW